MQKPLVQYLYKSTLIEITSLHIMLQIMKSK